MSWISPFLSLSGRPQGSEARFLVTSTLARSCELSVAFPCPSFLPTPCPHRVVLHGLGLHLPLHLHGGSCAQNHCSGPRVFFGPLEQPGWVEMGPGCLCVAGAPELPRGDKSRGCWCWKGCGPGHGAWAAVCDTQAPLCLQISSSWSWVRWTSCSFRSTRPPHVQSTTKASSASSGSLRPCEPCGRSESFGGSG